MSEFFDEIMASIDETREAARDKKDDCIMVENKKRPAHSAFEGPTIGTVYPKGSILKELPDGHVTIVVPEKTGKKK
ncbi:MAG: hypothetical protein K6E50_14860 [Lachnospiraceae bacterium]|nr:hypothetical protein [Lachnospiraceae bacterium]